MSAKDREDAREAAQAVRDGEPVLVMYGDKIQVGDRVKHYGQRFTGSATATVTGFEIIDDPRLWNYPWVKVHVKRDNPDSQAYPSPWDWDRVEDRT